MKLISLLSGKGFVMYNKALAHKVSVNGSIIFGQLCSSYESFGSKNMLTVRENKEYFFLTSGTLEEETALTYKQQLKAIKELEEAGYITTKVMGVPSKKFFHLTNKIAEELLVDGNPSSDKKEDLKSTEDLKPNNEEEPSLAQREILAEPKGNSKPVQKGPTIKKKNKKEQDKNINNFNCNYKEPLTSDQFKILLTNASNELYTKFSIGRYSKKQWNTLIEKFVRDTIESNRYLNVPVHKIKGYAFKSLEIITHNSDYKHSEEFTEYQEIMYELSNSTNQKSRLYNWLEN
jgi:DNA-binding PadR family transcriptional regulator